MEASGDLRLDLDEPEGLLIEFLSNGTSKSRMNRQASSYSQKHSINERSFPFIRINIVANSMINRAPYSP